MKVIFLDFDGVICTGRQAIATGEKGIIYGIDPVSLIFLNRICRENNVQVVISSSWRSGRTRRDFKGLFAAGGYIDLSRAMHANWKTPGGSTRGHEIQAWLDENECDGYVILDDDPKMLPTQLKYFVCTDSLNGMLVEHYVRCEELITGKAIGKIIT